MTTRGRGYRFIAPAKAYYQQVLPLAEALGIRPLQAPCHHNLGTLYTKIGQREQARAELVAAISLNCDMEMMFWLPRAEAALVQVPSRPLANLYDVGSEAPRRAGQTT
jgi:hypothetical protein